MTSVRCDSRHRQTGTGRSPEMVGEETGASGINMRFLISGDASQKAVAFRNQTETIKIHLFNHCLGDAAYCSFSSGAN